MPLTTLEKEKRAAVLQGRVDRLNAEIESLGKQLDLAKSNLKDAKEKLKALNKQ